MMASIGFIAIIVLALAYWFLVFAFLLPGLTLPDRMADGWDET